MCDCSFLFVWTLVMFTDLPTYFAKPVRNLVRWSFLLYPFPLPLVYPENHIQSCHFTRRALEWGFTIY